MDGHFCRLVDDRSLADSVCDAGGFHPHGGRQDDSVPIVRQDWQESPPRSGRPVPDGSHARARRRGIMG